MQVKKKKNPLAAVIRTCLILTILMVIAAGVMTASVRRTGKTGKTSPEKNTASDSAYTATSQTTARSEAKDITSDNMQDHIYPPEESHSDIPGSDGYIPPGYVEPSEPADKPGAPDSLQVVESLQPPEDEETIEGTSTIPDPPEKHYTPKKDQRYQRYINIEGLENYLGPEITATIEPEPPQPAPVTPPATASQMPVNPVVMPEQPARYDKPPRPAHPGPITIACIGDSITAGAGLANISAQSYPAQLQGFLGSEYQVTNYGVGGTTLSDTGDYPYKSTDSHRLSIEKNADIYIIMLGSNDAKRRSWNPESYKQQLSNMSREYMGLSARPVVLLMSEPKAFVPGGAFAPDYAIDSEIVDTIGPLVRSVASSLNLTMIDMYGFTKEHPDWFGDGLHPNVEGCRQIATMIAGAIRGIYR